MAKFFRRGVSKIRFVPTIIATTKIPTRAEIAAGVDLSPAVTAIGGFQLTNSPIPTPNLAEVFTSQIDGEDTVADSSLTFLDDDTTETIRTAVAKGTAGYIVLLPYGDVPTKRGEVWPAKSTGVNDEWSLGNDPARFQVGFAITATPNQDFTIPSAV